MQNIKKIALVIAVAGIAAAAFYGRSMAQGDPHAAAKALFETNCATCHAGGERAPMLSDNAKLRQMDEEAIAAIIKSGTPAGMPSFASLPAADVAKLAAWIRSNNKSALGGAAPEQVAAGEKFFFGEGGCSGCHMVRGQGGSNGPDLSNLAARSVMADIVKVLDNPTSQMGVHSLSVCPPWAFCPDFQWAVVNVTMKDGSKMRGFGRSQNEHELQLQTFDGQIHLLDSDKYTSVVREAQSYMPPLKASADQRRDLLAYISSLGGIADGPLEKAAPVTQAEIDQIMKPKKGNWTTYHGEFGGNRHSPLDQINASNVNQLQPQFIVSPGGSGLEGTPIVIDGMMYITGGPFVCALNARTGSRLWCVPRNNGLGNGVAAPANRRNPTAGAPTGPNRGVAVLGDRVFYVSDDAHMVSLNRLTGAVMWSRELAEKGAVGRPYNSSSPLVVGDLVISGVAGGDGPLRGFVVAYKADTGKEAWRFHTLPREGEPAFKTWIGRGHETGGGATWTTGSYDPETNTLFWAVGNPWPDTDPDTRGGTNLYTNSVVALDLKTGKLKWHFQYVPYDTHDWDATQPLVMVDTTWKGKPRKLLLSAQRSGVYYVLDRVTGEFLLAKPFVHKITWVDGFRKDGSPILRPGNDPTVEGTKTCPGVRGATNWYATSFDASKRLFYVMAAEDCGIYRKTGKIFGNNPDPSEVGTRLVRALNVETGDIVWEKLLNGPQETNYTGVLTTDGGLLFHGETGGNFAAVDSGTGKTLWTFRGNESFRASPMTYTVDGRQYVAVMNSTTLMSFALGYK